MKYALSVLILFCSCALPAQDTLNIEGKTWVGSLKDGKRNGLWEEYSIDTLLSRGWFRSDNKEGQWEYYGISHYGDNEIIASGSYRNGMKEGEWTHSGGYQYWKGNYVHGKKEGTWLYYDAEIDDNLIMKGNFIGGIAEGVFESYNEDGSVSATGKMIKGQPAGIWRIYNQDGTLSACGELLMIQSSLISIYGICPTKSTGSHSTVIRSTVQKTKTGNGNITGTARPCLQPGYTTMAKKRVSGLRFTITETYSIQAFTVTGRRRANGRAGTMTAV